MSSTSDLDRRRIILASAAAATLGAVLGATQTAQADQPHMRSALQSLRSAQGQLSIATHNKSGHRENALDLVNQAITQVEEGIAAGEGF